MLPLTPCEAFLSPVYLYAPFPSWLLRAHPGDSLPDELPRSTPTSYSLTRRAKGSLDSAAGRGSGRAPASTSGAAGRSANSFPRLGGGGGERRGRGAGLLAPGLPLRAGGGRRARGAAAPEAGGMWPAPGRRRSRQGCAGAPRRRSPAVCGSPGRWRRRQLCAAGPRNCPTQRERGLSGRSRSPRSAPARPASPR